MPDTIEKTKKYNLNDLQGIMAKLRAPDGCPWDREQTFDSLRSYLLEESYETVDAIDRKDSQAQCEELGDVLLQIVFQSQIASEENLFDLADVVDGIARKLIRRHPHVFGTESAETPTEVIKHWERIKKEEKSAPPTTGFESMLDRVPRTFPALLASHKLSERAARVGFDWPTAQQVLDKVDEELAEVHTAWKQEDPQRQLALAWEIGDLLFSLANLARHLGTCAEDLLREANLRFRSRFGLVERLAEQRKMDLKKAKLDVLESLWQQAKKTLSNPVTNEYSDD